MLTNLAHPYRRFIVEVREEPDGFGWYDFGDMSTRDESSPTSPDCEAPSSPRSVASTPKKISLKRAMKKKQSDALFARGPDGQEYELLPVKLPRTKRRTLAKLAMLTSLIVIGLIAYARHLNKSVPNDNSAALKLAAKQLRPNRGVTIRRFVQGTEELGPVFKRIGLSRMVEVNLDKLRSCVSMDETLESQLKRDFDAGESELDASATVAVLWNGRILEFVHALVEGILASDLLDDDDQSGDGGHKQSLPDVAKLAYERTLMKHHNAFLRSAARGLLSFAPTHDQFFRDHLGYPPTRWSTSLRADLHDIDTALSDCLAYVRLALKRQAAIVL